MTPRQGVVLDGRYELTSRIAIGGMGEVWRARDVLTEKVLAAKVMRPEFAGEQVFLDRIAAEARNTRELDHPSIARTYDSGVVGGLGYLVMELVDGEPLSDVLRRRRTLLPREILEIVAQTADALAVAHASGVVHRDIKPGNLLVTQDGTVTLTDFGISIGENQAPMTDAGMVMGTAQYLPPEQAMGKPATGAGDLYALGIIAYEALAGKRPFTGTTQVDIAFAHVTEPLPPLPETVDEPLRALVEQLLAKDPTDRPASAAEVAARARTMLEDLRKGVWDPSRARDVWRAARQRATGRPAGSDDGAATSAVATRPARGRSAALREAPPVTPEAPPSAPAAATPLAVRRDRREVRAPGREWRRLSRRQTMIALAVLLAAVVLTILVLTIANLGAPAALAAVALLPPVGMDRVTHPRGRGWHTETDAPVRLASREVR